MSIIKHFSQGNQDSEDASPSDYWRGHGDAAQDQHKKINEAYNTGVEYCIEVATNYYKEIKPYTRSGVPYISEPHFNQLISKLEQLKKPAQ